MIKVVDCYSWVYDIVRAVALKKSVPVDEINLVGGRKSAKSKSMQILFALLASLPTDSRIGLCSLRLGKENSAELYADFEQTLEMLEIPYSANKGKMEFRFKTGRKIRVLGLNSMSRSQAQKSGLANFGELDYLFIYFEERFEFSTTDFSAAREAIRAVGDYQVIIINVCNPWAKSNEYIQYCSSNMEWNINKMKTTGNQVGIFETEDYETKIKTIKLFQYTNWRVAQNVLSKAEIAGIKDTWNIDRNRALTTDYGMPGYEWGAIYTHLLNKIGQPILQQDPTHIIAGVDFGWSSSSNGGKTAAVFGVATREVGIDIYGEYHHDPAVKPLSPDQVALQIVEFFKKQMVEYCFKIGREVPFYTKVKVDNMVVGFIQILNNVTKKLGLHHWLHFTKCAKFPIVDRIDIQQAIMGYQKFRMDSNCIHLLREFEISHYKEKVEKRERAKGEDHTLNAYEYGMENVMYMFAKELLTDRTFKQQGENTVW